mmetsp:Transcript_34862/g.84224  ORF Transcript_34862/g.84224 Transcript_34862/m.84224 type:complete len:117 (-) Transcript_34862:38-388(-)
MRFSLAVVAAAADFCPLPEFGAEFKLAWECPVGAGNAKSGLALIQLRGAKTEVNKAATVATAERTEVEVLQDEARASEDRVHREMEAVAGAMHNVATAMKDSPCAFSAHGERGCET